MEEITADTTKSIRRAELGKDYVSSTEDSDDSSEDLDNTTSRSNEHQKRYHENNSDTESLNPKYQRIDNDDTCILLNGRLID